MNLQQNAQDVNFQEATTEEPLSEDLALSPSHLQQLTEGSGIDLAVVRERGYRTVTDRKELLALGFKDYQARVPALLIPLYNTASVQECCVLRPDDPRRDKDGKPIKYETPEGARMLIDVHPRVRARLQDPKEPLFITEGMKKGDSLVSRGLCGVALLGVWNWRGKNEQGISTVLADFDEIPREDRQVYIVFDSDAAEKYEVHQALVKLTGVLKRRKAHVQVITLPSGVNGAKVGVDDFFVAGGTVEDLLKWAKTKLPPLPPRYFVQKGGMWLGTGNKDGEYETRRLTNFTAHITANVTVDDGAETTKHFEIEATVDGRTASFCVPATKFRMLDWVYEQLGAGAIIESGSGIQDHVRTAIQKLSRPVERRVYAHLGWRKHNGRWVYLHAGGAIDEKGIVTDVEVAVGALAEFRLPGPPRGGTLRNAVKASLSLLDVAPDHISILLLAATYRAPLGDVGFNVHLAGQTGVGKSELAALAQQHFGAGMHAKNLPAAWVSTTNSNERLAFLAKDALLVVDDFVPQGSGRDLQRMKQGADRLLRSQANHQARARMTADGALQPAKPPQSLLLSTGESSFDGASLNARVLTIEVRKDDMRWEKMTSRQQDAEAGLYAQAMAGFVQWLAPYYEELKDGLPNDLRTYRKQIGALPGHARTPEMVASLLLGWSVLLDFALNSGAGTEDEVKTLWKRGCKVIKGVAVAQQEHQVANDPARQFLELLRAAIKAGDAHIAEARDGFAPINGSVWGWRLITLAGAANDPANPRGEWRAQGKCVGWVDENKLYLEPTSALLVAESYAERTHQPLSLSVGELGKRLRDAGLLVECSQEKGRVGVKKTIAGQRLRVWYLKVDSLENA